MYNLLTIDRQLILIDSHDAVTEYNLVHYSVGVAKLKATHLLNTYSHNYLNKTKHSQNISKRNS